MSNYQYTDAPLAEPERMLSYKGEQWVSRTDYMRLRAERDRLQMALREIIEEGPGPSPSEYNHLRNVIAKAFVALDHDERANAWEILHKAYNAD